MAMAVTKKVCLLLFIFQIPKLDLDLLQCSGYGIFPVEPILTLFFFLQTISHSSNMVIM